MTHSLNLNDRLQAKLTISGRGMFEGISSHHLLPEQCALFIPGNVCSTRGKCHDDDLARTESAQHGNGSCLCQEPFFGANCELGGCPAGYEYVQRKHWTCVACQKGWYKQAVGNNVPCSPCQANRFMPVLGGASCLRCEDMWLRVQVNKEKTACTRAMVNVLAIPTAFILAAGFFVMLPYVSGLPLAVRDVRLGQEGVMVTTKVRHWMLSGKRKMHLRCMAHPDRLVFGCNV